MTTDRNSELRRTLRLTAGWIAAVAFVFCAVVAGLLIRDARQNAGYRIDRDPQTAELKAELLDRPDDEALKQTIRELDLDIREKHLARMAFVERGRWLLWIGGAVVVASLAVVVVAGRPFPDLPLPAAPAGAQHRRATWALLAIGAVTFVGFFAAAGVGKYRMVMATSSVPDDKPEAQADLHLNWPRFRGPTGCGVTEHPAVLPGVDGATVAWRSDLPLPGNGSPVLWGNRIYLTGANARRREVYAYDARTGKRLWTATVPSLPGSPTEAPELYGDGQMGTGFAASTGCTDGQRFYAVFANGDLVAVTPDGKIAWARALGMPANPYGLAASLTMFDGMLAVPFDQSYGRDADGKDVPRSKLLLIDPANGKTLREIPRDAPASWTTPIVIGIDGRELLITAADPEAIAYAADGSVAWKHACLSGDVAPSPVAADGRVFVTMQAAGLSGLDAKTGQGLWENYDVEAPDITSPLASPRFVWILTTQGFWQCIDATTGKGVYEHDFDGETFFVSPSLTGPEGQHVLLINAKGHCRLLDADGEFKIVAEADLDEPVFASPAFGPGVMVVRGKSQLLLVQSPDPSNKSQQQ